MEKYDTAAHCITGETYAKEMCQEVMLPPNKEWRQPSSISLSEQKWFLESLEQSANCNHSKEGYSILGNSSTVGI